MDAVIGCLNLTGFCTGVADVDGIDMVCDKKTKCQRFLQNHIPHTTGENIYISSEFCQRNNGKFYKETGVL
jgi:hypothetical protein